MVQVVCACFFTPTSDSNERNSSYFCTNQWPSLKPLDQIWAYIRINVESKYGCNVCNHYQLFWLKMLWSYTNCMQLTPAKKVISLIPKTGLGSQVKWLGSFGQYHVTSDLLQKLFQQTNWIDWLASHFGGRNNQTT